MKKVIGIAMSLTVLAAAAWSFSPRPLPAFAATVLRADRLQLNGIARSGNRLVAVGERGTILLSDDEGAHWRLASVMPEHGAALTQLVFAGGKDDKVGVAVGHSGWILRTTDGGEHWQQVAFDAAQSDPLLGVWGQATGPWFAIGSFGRFLVSHDQGGHWQSAATPLMQDKHLNGIAGDHQGRLMLVGESGLVLRSADGGSTWEAVKMPYEGSLYGVLPLRDGAWLVYGMRGNVLRSADFGASWEAAEVGLKTSFFGGVQLADGRIAVAGQGGMLAVSADGGRHFKPVAGGSAQTLAALIPATRGNALTLAGNAGIARFNLAPHAAP
ncbi:WD40/YVTN/BNR-like repeat-containing protein [Cupriavidus sp. YAF13]|uniref:WD40/YVTN/BNR-like repeat-containing protein n=1 Tax=Cupriavidus sp. YAF13 TaxID=3233075 RepID=UPI003F926954